MHKVICLNFASLVSERWNSLPNIEQLKKQLAVAALAHSELHDIELGLAAPPGEVREVKISAAAADQIQCMWHGHRLSLDNTSTGKPLICYGSADERRPFR
ncbi:hypothetical protein BZM27_37490 [Paraburkholderia steynii]|uniref:Uncharacterized protein n=1 Tax=Paraburkholderia steynii TaxID=1245441 RepID=A0A4R0X7R5_9BURK|nr:hypothetical protein BZM27_37490 [Paraburkholderia steynii]